MRASRRLSRESGKFVRVTPGSQSLERGIRILRAFLEGAPNLVNSELATRTRLPKATVSRLSRSLVDAGMLEFDSSQEAYRLAPSCLSFARAFLFSRFEIGAVSSLLSAFARENQINVGLSSPDHTHMIYVTTFREGRGTHTRLVAAGLRLPIDTCSAGIAYLAHISSEERMAICDSLSTAYGEKWPTAYANLENAIERTKTLGFSQARSGFGNAGVGTIVLAPRGSIYGLNASYPAADGLPPDLTVRKLGKKLIVLASEVQTTWNKLIDSN